MNGIRGALVLGLMPAMLAACADDTVWKHPNAPVEQRGRDESACRRAAALEAERDYTIRQEEVASGRDRRSGAYRTQMSQFSSGKNRDELFNRCMARQGYKKVPRDESKAASEAQEALQPQ